MTNIITKEGDMEREECPYDSGRIRVP